MIRSVVCRKHQARFFSSTLKSWERSAKLVKSTDVNNQYLEHIRTEHDPSLHVKTIEDELRGTMGKALGRQGEKIMFALRRMEEQRRRLDTLEGCNNEIRECVILYNQFREEAKQARWELVVQRQAIGFLVNNQKVVHEKYPIGDALPLPQDDGTLPEPKIKEKQEFGDQLDWWQRIGRWR
jgi:hypothetical protein